MKNTQIKPYIEENKFKFTFEYEPVFVNCCPENMDKLFIKIKMWARPTIYRRIRYQDILDMVKYLGFSGFDFVREYEIETDKFEREQHVEKIYVYAETTLKISEFLERYTHVNGGDLNYLIGVTVMRDGDEDCDSDHITTSDDNTDSEVLINDLNPNSEYYYSVRG